MAYPKCQKMTRLNLIVHKLALINKHYEQKTQLQ